MAKLEKLLNKSKKNKDMNKIKKYRRAMGLGGHSLNKGLEV